MQGNIGVYSYQRLPSVGAHVIFMCQHVCDPHVIAYNDLCHGYTIAMSDTPHKCAVEKLLEDVVSQIWP